MMSRTRIRARRRWTDWLLAGALGLTGVALLLYGAATHSPSWYRPAVVAPADYAAIRNELPTFGSAIGTHLKQGQPFRIILTDEEINRWIAAREQIWPGFKDALPSGIEDPVIAFQPGRIVAGIRYATDRVTSVLSLGLTAEVEASGAAIRIGVGDFRIGLLPVPRALVEDAAKRALARAIRDNIRAFSSQLAEMFDLDERSLEDALDVDEEILASLLNIRELRLQSHHVWPNGRFPFRIANLEIEQGRLLIDITPLPRQADSRTSDSTSAARSG